MKSFWVWLAILVAIWVSALLETGIYEVPPYRWAGCALFMLIFFISPLYRNKPTLLTAMLSAAVLLTAGVFYPVNATETGQFNPYVLLIYSFFFGVAVYRLPAKHTLIVGSAALLALLFPAWSALPSLPGVFLLLFAIMYGLAAWSYQVNQEKLQETTELQAAMNSEYRRLKRYAAVEEDVARQQERTKIARDLHDSLGHKLTALLMQLEMLRMQQSQDQALGGQLAQLKELAQDSLNETRSAVSALHQEQPSGLRAIMELIRKLEAESFVRIRFSLGEGVLSAQLDSDTSVGIYRAIQESLTNAMRHGSSRQIEINFELPGAAALRFEVSNTYEAHDDSFRQGFGLTAMRERIEALNGQLNIVRTTNQFIVEGIVPLGERRTKDDSNSAGRGSGNGAPRTENDD